MKAWQRARLITPGTISTGAANAAVRAGSPGDQRGDVGGDAQDGPAGVAGRAERGEGDDAAAAVDGHDAGAAVQPASSPVRLPRRRTPASRAPRRTPNRPATAARSARGRRRRRSAPAAPTPSASSVRRASSALSEPSATISAGRPAWASGDQKRPLAVAPTNAGALSPIPACTLGLPYRLAARRAEQRHSSLRLVKRRRAASLDLDVDVVGRRGGLAAVAALGRRRFGRLMALPSRWVPGGADARPDGPAAAPASARGPVDPGASTRLPKAPTRTAHGGPRAGPHWIRFAGSDRGRRRIRPPARIRMSLDATVAQFAAFRAAPPRPWLRFVNHVSSNLGRSSQHPRISPA